MIRTPPTPRAMSARRLTPVPGGTSSHPGEGSRDGSSSAIDGERHGTVVSASSSGVEKIDGGSGGPDLSMLGSSVSMTGL
jgi:hypothetical protein